MTENLECTKNLKEYYKYIYLCSQCKREYGSDLKQKTFLCPICGEKLKGNNSRISRSLR